MILAHLAAMRPLEAGLLGAALGSILTVWLGRQHLARDARRIAAQRAVTLTDFASPASAPEIPPGTVLVPLAVHREACARLAGAGFREACFLAEIKRLSRQLEASDGARRELARDLQEAVETCRELAEKIPCVVEIGGGGSRKPDVPEGT